LAFFDLSSLRTHFWPFPFLRKILAGMAKKVYGRPGTRLRRSYRVTGGADVTATKILRKQRLRLVQARKLRYLRCLLLKRSATPRQLRIQYEGAIYRLLSRGDRREEIFGVIWIERVFSGPSF